MAAASVVVTPVMVPPGESRCDRAESQRNCKKAGDHEVLLHHQYSRSSMRILRDDRQGDRDEANTWRN
jgi:hypothetical protein